MTATTFNPLATARELEATGIERRQAEAIAEGMRNAADAAAGADRADFATKADLAGFATKADLAGVRDELRADLAGVRDELRADLHREIGTLRSELRWMLAFQAALILAIAAKLFGIV